MGVFTHQVIMQRVGFCILLGFTLVAFVSLIFLSGRGRESHYDGRPVEPLEDYGGWVQEGSGRVPVYLKVWMVAIAGWAVTMTGIVIHHGYRY